MKFSYAWIQSHIVEQLPHPEGLAEKIIFHAFEIESLERHGEDTILDIKVLPDRAGDCFSHYGMAREIAGLYGFTLKPQTRSALPERTLDRKIEVHSEFCDRYLAVEMDNITVGPSPQWIQDRLAAIGQQSINVIVDIANLVMFDTGQPLHVFDAKKIDGGLIVRQAHNNETIITLSGEEKALTEEMVVIADYVGVVALAGVKGGKTAEVDMNTTSIILEAAHFDAVSIRKTSRRLNLLTEASRRFENNLPADSAQAAAQMFIGLLSEMQQLRIAGSYDYYPNPTPLRVIDVSTKGIAGILGESIGSDEHIVSWLTRYNYSYDFHDGTYTITIPSFRADLTNLATLAEEVGRVAGYEHVEPKKLSLAITSAHNTTFEKIQKIKWYLRTKGFSEVMTYTLRKKGELTVAYGPKNRSALRTNLSEGLQESYELNRLQAPVVGLREVRIFEIGTVFAQSGEEIRVATSDGGTVQEMSLEAFYEAHESDIEKLSIPVASLTHPTSFQMWSLFPFVVRDVAVWVNDDAHVQDLETIATAFAKDECIRPPFKFDDFILEDKRSVAYRFVFQAPDRTLTDAEVGSKWAGLLERLTEKGFIIR